MGVRAVALKIKQFASGPAGLSGESTLYPKTDGKWYTRNGTATEVALATATDLSGKANSTHTHPASDLTATGARDSGSFLRGDNVWVAPGDHTVCTLTNTVGTGQNCWTKIATLTINGQYGDTNGALEFYGNGSGASTSGMARVEYRLKQQNAMGALPTGSVWVNDMLGGFTADRFIIIISENSTTRTVGELWMKAPNGYEQYRVYERKRVTNNATIVYHTNFGYAQGATAPTSVSSVFTGVDAESNHNHDGRYYTETEVNTLLNGKAASTHNHDDRYYTEAEVNTLLGGKSDTSHAHAATSLTGDFSSLSLAEQATAPAVAAGQARIYVKSDGLPYIKNDNGDEYPLVALPKPTAYANANLDDWTNGGPTGWYRYWRDNPGSTSVSAAWTRDTTDKVSGAASWRIDMVSNAIGRAFTPVFSVAPNDMVTITFAARATGTAPKIDISLLTKASGQPNYFEPGVSNVQTASPVIASGWAYYTAKFRVPPGHFVACVDYNPNGQTNPNSFWIDDTSVTIESQSGFDPFHVQAVCTTGTTVTTTTSTALPGMSVDVTAPDANAVYEVTVDVDCSITVSGTLNVVEIVVDGAAWAGANAQLVTQQSGGGSIGRIAGSKTWRVTGLSAGVHTIAARTRNTAASTSATIGANNSHMIVQRVM